MAEKYRLTTSDYLPYSEYEKLLNGLHKDKKYFWELYARLGFCTACRASDVLALRWGQILNVPRVCIKEKKTGKARIISFNESVRKKIASLYKLLNSPDLDAPVFYSSMTGEPITIQQVNRTLKLFKYRYQLKINHFSTHTFRKTFGRYVYDHGPNKSENLLLLNKIFNHTSIQVTKTYIGITQDEIDKVYNSIRF